VVALSFGGNGSPVLRLPQGARTKREPHAAIPLNVHKVYEGGCSVVITLLILPQIPLLLQPLRSAPRIYIYALAFHVEAAASDSGNMSSMSSRSFHPRRLPPWRCIKRSIFACIQVYLNSIDNLFYLWLFNSTAAALISHKIMFIRLHSPLPVFGVIMLSPCLFLFDFINLLVLHSGLSSPKFVWNVLSGIVGVVLIICSCAFASLFINGNAELNWSRSVQVNVLN